MPTAQADTAGTLTGVPVTIAVLANDAGSGLAIAGYTQPATGTLVLEADQSFTYTPAAGFTGSDGFTYTVQDSAGQTAAGQVTITVSQPNRPPVAANDTGQVTAGNSVVLPVLANDNDPDGDPLSLLAIDAPGHGTIRVEPGQKLRYTPQQGFAGIDSFAYTVGDGRGGAATASVMVTVTLPNRPPVAAPDTAATTAGTAVTIDVLANDNDPEGDPLRLAGMSLPGHGTLTPAAGQRFLYTPAAGFTGSDSFTYSVRDSRGARATGTVSVEVDRANAAPVAVPDSAATSSGEPVTLDLLANDDDPDGDPLQLAALTLPVGGQVAVNPDRTVTYTPAAGFSGTDSFTYTVSDGVARSEADVAVTVTSTEIPTFANGYRCRRRLIVPARATQAQTVTDFVLLVREQDDRLKPAAAGGKVESAAGHDIRFELEDGTKLDHELERYDPLAGRLVAWVRVPSWQPAQRLAVLLYYGKPALAATEANPAGVWQGYLAVYDARTGADRTGQGRDLTPSNVAAAELIGDAGAYDGAAVASRSDASFLAGRSAITVQAMVAADAAMVGSDHGWLAQGPMDGTDGSAGLIMQYLPQSNSGTAKVIHFKVACSDGQAFVLSAADMHRAGPQLLHGVWQQGQAPALFVDGAAVEPSNQSAPRSGTLSPAAGSLYLGAGARDAATGGWRGLIDEVRIAPAALPAVRIAAEAANLATPQMLYGLGGEDAADDADQASVAVPVEAATVAGSHVDIDVAALAYDPDSATAGRVVAVGTPAHGIATVIGQVIRYTPVAGYVGKDSFSYTLEGGGKRSTSTVRVVVSANSDAGETWPEWTGRWATVPALAAVPAGNVVLIDTNARLSLLNSTQAGRSYVVSGNRTGNGATYTIGATGTETAPVVIRGSDDGSDPRRYPELSDCTLRITGRHVVVTKLRLRRVTIETRDAENTQVLGNWFYDIDNPEQSRFVYINGDYASRYTRIAYNWFKENGSYLIRSQSIDTTQLSVDTPPRHILIERNLFEGWADNPSSSFHAFPIYLGRSNNTCPLVDLDAYVRWNLFRGCRQQGPASENKASGVYYFYNTIDCSTGRGMYLRIRHGRTTRETTAAIGTGRGSQAVGNLFIQASNNRQECGIQARDGYHVIRNNWCVVLDAANAQPTVSSPIGTGEVLLHSGTLDWAGFPDNAPTQPAGSRYVHAAKVVVGGNRLAVKVGFVSSPPMPFKPVACRVAPADPQRRDRNAAITVIQEEGTDYVTPVADADYTRVPARLLDSQVGPEAM